MTPQRAPVSFLKKFFSTAPVIFPLIALFHIGLLLYICITWFDPGVSWWFWLRPVVMALYTWFWIGACYLRKRGATAYLVLTIVMVSFYYFGPTGGNNLDGQSIFREAYNQLVLLHRAVADILLDPLPANILFSFIILLYYRRMRPKRAKLQESAANLPGGSATNPE
ncbi:MAG TPA: hypothetical protein VFL76_01025 [Edaphocola sp.]|nr:hypothetical protein [Edaphocola sp.]